jgi:hypothetical protein
LDQQGIILRRCDVLEIRLIRAGKVTFECKSIGERPPRILAVRRDSNRRHLARIRAIGSVFQKR